MAETTGTATLSLPIRITRSPQASIDVQTEAYKDQHVLIAHSIDDTRVAQITHQLSRMEQILEYLKVLYR
jgi:hypothetical protein